MCACALTYQSWYKRQRLNLCANLSNSTLCTSNIPTQRRDQQTPPTAARTEGAWTEVAELRWMSSCASCAQVSARYDPRSLSNQDRRVPERQRAEEKDAEGRHGRVASRVGGRLTDILAVTPKGSGDEQRQQHQRLGSPEADHGSPRGLAEPGPSGAQRGGRSTAWVRVSTVPSCSRPVEQEEEAGDPAAQQRSASSPRRSARYMRPAPLEASELAQTAGRPWPPTGL